MYNGIITFTDSIKSRTLRSRTSKALWRKEDLLDLIPTHVASLLTCHEPLNTQQSGWEYGLRSKTAWGWIPTRFLTSHLELSWASYCVILGTQARSLCARVSSLVKWSKQKYLPHRVVGIINRALKAGAGHSLSELLPYYITGCLWCSLCLNNPTLSLPGEHIVIGVMSPL